MELNVAMQELFDKQLKAMIEQGVPSIDTYTSTCRYRIEDKSVCCGIGHLISDEYYSDNLEAQCVLVTEVFDAVLYSQNLYHKFNGEEQSLLCEFLDSCQQCHDCAACNYLSSLDKEQFMFNYIYEMRKVARKYSLDFYPDKNPQPQN